MNSDNMTKILTFLRMAEKLKDTLRSAHTSSGRRESSAEHTWRLCLMILILHAEFKTAQLDKMLKLALVHDLAEAVCGDTPAPVQAPKEDKARVERQGMLALCKALPAELCAELMALWDDYEYGQSLEAKLVKGLDKLETLLQHNQGKNPADFDYNFNLEYGQEYTSIHPFIQQLRAEIDQDTRKKM